MRATSGCSLTLHLGLEEKPTTVLGYAISFHDKCGETEAQKGGPEGKTEAQKG